MSKLSGLTKADCPAGCNVNGCVIADGKPFCAHPCKSGVPVRLKNDPAIQKLYGEACAALGVPNNHLVMQ